MAEDLCDDWWDTDSKSKIIKETESPEESGNKNKKRKRKRITEVDTNLMSSEDEVKTVLNELIGNVAREELSEWIDQANIRLVR